MRQWIRSALVRIMACLLFGAKQLSEPVLGYWTLRKNFSEVLIKIQNFSFTKMHLKISSEKGRSLCPGEMSYYMVALGRHANTLMSTEDSLNIRGPPLNCLRAPLNYQHIGISNNTRASLTAELPSVAVYVQRIETVKRSMDLLKR